jgi:hypothetical protein
VKNVATWIAREITTAMMDVGRPIRHHNALRLTGSTFAPDLHVALPFD